MIGAADQRQPPAELVEVAAIQPTQFADEFAIQAVSPMWMDALGGAFLLGEARVRQARSVDSIFTNIFARSMRFAACDSGRTC
jgi:hypothetical protein